MLMRVSMFGLALQIAERVAPPAHIPLEIKAEAAVVDGLREPGLAGRRSGKGDGVRVEAAQLLI